MLLVLIIFIICFILLSRIFALTILKNDLISTQNATRIQIIENIFRLDRFTPINKKLLRTMRIKYIVSLIHGGVSGLIFGIHLFGEINFDFTGVLEMLVILAIVILLLYMSIYDIYFYEIPKWSVNILLALTIVSNIFAGIITLFRPNSFEYFGELQNLIAGVILGGIFLIVTKITKEKGLGLGDVFLMFSIGITLGVFGGVQSYLITLLSASIFGLIYSVFKGKINGLIIPLVPFIYIGFVTSLALGDTLIRYFYLF